MMSCILMLILLVGTAAAQSTLEVRRTLCGRELAKAHYMYCSYSFGAALKEPVDIVTAVADLDNDVTKIPERFTFKMQRALERLQYENNLVRTCCVKPCHINELLDHC